MSNSLAHPLRALGLRQTTQHKHEYNAHCNRDSCALENPAQTIEMHDNPSPLNFFAVPSHTATAFICGLSLLQAHNGTSG